MSNEPPGQHLKHILMLIDACTCGQPMNADRFRMWITRIFVFFQIFYDQPKLADLSHNVEYLPTLPWVVSVGTPEFGGMPWTALRASSGLGLEVAAVDDASDCINVSPACVAEML